MKLFEIIKTNIRNVQKMKFPIKLESVTSISRFINTFFIPFVIILVNQSPINKIRIATSKILENRY